MDRRADNSPSIVDNMPVEVVGVVESIVYRNDDNGYTVLELADDDEYIITAVGVLPFVNQGERIQLKGKWDSHRVYGEQLRIDDFKIVTPNTLMDMEKYLSSGLIKGVGPSMARRLVTAFGLDTLNIIQFNPDKLTDISGIGPKKAAQIASSYEEQKDIREVTLFLQKYGVSTAYIVKIYKEFGSDTISRVKENPYTLADNIKGIGFKMADTIAISMGIAPDSPFRIQSGVLYSLSRAVIKGHTCIPREELVRNSADILEVDRDVADMAVTNLAVNLKVRVDEVDGVQMVWIISFYAAEVSVAQRILALSRQEIDRDIDDIEERIFKWEKANGIYLAENQRLSVSKALTCGCMVITGGPGTGKTTTLKCIISLLEQSGLKIALAAPTGRAAKRMTQATGRDAKTIHRMLKYGAGSGDDGVFTIDENEPLKEDVIIVDEMSMVDILLMNHLLKGIARGARLIMVGDADQLPSVGPGNVLRDIISSSMVDTVCLNTIFRQAGESMIIVNAHKILKGDYPILNKKDKDFFSIEESSPQKMLDVILDLVTTRLPKYKKYHPEKDIQILSPMKKGITGVLNINMSIQARINPPSVSKPEKTMGDVTYRVGDKIMQIKNNYRIKWKIRDSGEEGEGVFNGDIGFIEGIDSEEETLNVIMDDDKMVEYHFDELDEIMHAWAVTIHKSQGSEFPVVIIPMSWGPPMLMTRNLLYTAVTRAREMAVLVGRRNVISSMVDNNHIDKRYSGLNHQFDVIFKALGIGGLI